MRAIMSVVLMHVLAVGSATAGICHYCDNHHANLQDYYRFYLRDYQGNNRLTYTAAGVVLERNDYYPYGGLFGEEQSLQPYKYSGKELETTNGR